METTSARQNTSYKLLIVANYCSEMPRCFLDNVGGRYGNDAASNEGEFIRAFRYIFFVFFSVPRTYFASNFAQDNRGIDKSQFEYRF